MINILLMSLTVILGLVLTIIFKKSNLLNIILILLTFYLGRIFFGLEWKKITGSINAISLNFNFYWLLLINFVFLSVIFIFVLNYTTKQKLFNLGWNKDKLLRNILIGIVVGAVFFFLLSLNKQLKVENLAIAIFFSFFIASWQEENIFRGYLLKHLSSRYSTKEVIIYQALIYSLAHIGFYSFFPIANLFFSLIFAFVLGLVLGYLRIKTRNQISGFISHGIIDTAFLLM